MIGGSLEQATAEMTHHREEEEEMQKRKRGQRREAVRDAKCE